VIFFSVLFNILTIFALCKKITNEHAKAIKRKLLISSCNTAAAIIAVTIAPQEDAETIFVHKSIIAKAMHTL